MHELGMCVFTAWAGMEERLSLQAAEKKWAPKLHLIFNLPEWASILNSIFNLFCGHHTKYI